MGLDTKTYLLTDRQSQCDFDLKKIELSFEKPACQDVSLGTEEINWVASSELAVAE
jgi:hypothetical protein